MKITKGMRLTFVFAVSVALIWAVFFRGSDEDLGEVAGNGELQVRGREFKAEIQSEFKKMVSEESRRTYVLTDICNKYFPAGMLFSDIEMVMRAAGSRTRHDGESVLVPDYNHNLPADSPDRQDMGSGFLLNDSLISNTVFEITFRPHQESGEPKKLGKVMYCFARSTHL